MSAYLKEVPQPTQSLVITGRVCDTKYVFTQSNSTNVRYYVLVPRTYKGGQRHACGWCAIVHAGDNPKYHSLAESPLVGRCKRAMFWRRYYIEYGGSVQKDVKKEEKAVKEKKLKCTNRFRKFFCMDPKDLKWSEEEEAAISDEKGVVVEATKMLELKHTGHRRYEFEVDGRTYRWSGTKMHAGSFINKLGLKGFAFHIKLVRMDDHKLIASFKKCYLGKKGKFGELNLYGDQPETGVEEVLVVQTAFCMAKAEKEKRDRVRELLEEIGENAGG